MDDVWISRFNFYAFCFCPLSSRVGQKRSYRSRYLYYKNYYFQCVGTLGLISFLFNIAKINDRCFCYYTAAALVPFGRATTWRLHGYRSRHFSIIYLFIIIISLITADDWNLITLHFIPFGDARSRSNSVVDSYKHQFRKSRRAESKRVSF